jgi:hypothetical protein
MSTFDFDKQLEGFIAGVQKMTHEYYEKHFPDSPVLEPERIGIERGGRYIRVVKHRKWNGVETGEKSVHCFIDTKEGETKGNILKAAGWKAPAKNGVRGTIMCVDFGLSVVNHHGCIYIN